MADCGWCGKNLSNISDGAVYFCLSEDCEDKYHSHLGRSERAVQMDNEKKDNLESLQAENKALLAENKALKGLACRNMDPMDATKEDNKLWQKHILPLMDDEALTKKGGDDG